MLPTSPLSILNEYDPLQLSSVGRDPEPGPLIITGGINGIVMVGVSFTGPKVTACESENEAKKANADTR
jgi:hypothetical protein